MHIMGQDNFHIPLLDSTGFIHSSSQTGEQKFIMLINLSQRHLLGKKQGIKRLGIVVSILTSQLFEAKQVQCYRFHSTKSRGKGPGFVDRGSCTIKTMKRWKNTSGRSSIVDDDRPGEEHFTLRRAPALPASSLQTSNYWSRRMRRKRTDGITKNRRWCD